uniref:ZP domain-containing protein n=1 Tax=Oryzias sinensis TaxID=183150 RepID=A0A8C7XTE5_9TELE
MTVGCSSSPYTPGEVRFHLVDEPPVQTPPAPVTVLLRLATDESFTSFHPEARLPLSLVLSKPVYAELSLLDPSKPGMLLLVHSCLAYTLAPYLSWMLLYDGCPKQGISQLLPSPDSRHIKRMKITVFPSVATGSSSHSAQRRLALLEDPEVYFLCTTEVCSAASGDCSVSCKTGTIREFDFAESV